MFWQGRPTPFSSFGWPDDQDSEASLDCRAMAIKTEAIGKEWPSTTYEVGKEKIGEYARVIGLDNPVHTDRDAAKAAGYRDVVAPPMFCVVYSAPALGPAMFDSEVGMNFAAMVHGGFQPVYLPPVYDRELGVSLGPTRAAVHDLLAREHVDCVFLTSPNYYGIVGEPAAIIALAHERGLPVVVDAAHAPHFHFSAALPTAAEDAGADFVTQSTHKVATALSQGSVLLLRNRKSVPHLYEHINELGLVSTSFSYPILASIELGVLQLVEQGDAVWRETIARADAFRLTCRQLPGVSCFGREQDFKAGFAEIDRSRVTIDVSHTGLTGFEVERRLQAQHIYPELATLQNVLFLFTPGTSERDTTALYAALKAIVQTGTEAARISVPDPPSIPQIAVLPRVAKFATKSVVRAKAAVGRVSGETIATYPPGVPIVAAGEIVTSDIVEYLQYMLSHGAIIKGASDPALQTFRVL